MAELSGCTLRTRHTTNFLEISCLQVNTHQMVILMRFNHRNRFSFKELLVRLLIVV